MPFVHSSWFKTLQTPFKACTKPTLSLHIFGKVTITHLRIDVWNILTHTQLSQKVHAGVTGIRKAQDSRQAWMCAPFVNHSRDMALFWHGHWWKLSGKGFNIFRLVVYGSMSRKYCSHENVIRCYKLRSKQPDLTKIASSVSRLNWVWIWLQALFFSDITTTNGQQIDRMHLHNRLSSVTRSYYSWQEEQPTSADFIIWKQAIEWITGPGIYLHDSLGPWIDDTHRIWLWRW